MAEDKDHDPGGDEKDPKGIKLDIEFLHQKGVIQKEVNDRQTEDINGQEKKDKLILLEAVGFFSIYAPKKQCISDGQKDNHGQIGHMKDACFGVVPECIGVGSLNKQIRGPEAHQKSKTEDIKNLDVFIGKFQIMDNGLIAAQGKKNNAGITDSADEVRILPAVQQKQNHPGKLPVEGEKAKS
jgi:hypothetical protein